MVTQTDSELGRSLMTERGMQWLYAHGGDSYARVLRAEDGDLDALAAQIRERGPLHRSRTGAWVTGDHALGSAIIADPRLVSRVPDGLSDGHLLRRCEAFPRLSAAERDRVRERPELNPPASSVERVCDEVLGRVGDEFDLVADFLRPVVAGLVADLLVVPPARRETFTRWCGSAGVALDAVLCPPTLRHARSLTDVVGGLRSVLGEVAGPDEDRFAAGMLACVVGVEVTANLVANVLLALLDQPGRPLSDAGTGPADALVEQTLRDAPPVRVDSRAAREELTLAGHRIDAGAEVVVCIDAANQDPGLRRGPDDHLSLSGGPYLDLVAPLVRTAAVGALGFLTGRLPQLRQSGPVVRRLRAPVTHSVVRFPVTA